MTVFEAELAYEGYRRKEYAEWARVQRLGYIIACVNSTKPGNIKPNDIVNLDDFKDLFNTDVVDDVEEPKESPEEFLARMEKQTAARLELIRKSEESKKQEKII